MPVNISRVPGSETRVVLAANPTAASAQPARRAPHLQREPPRAGEGDRGMDQDGHMNGDDRASRRNAQVPG